jgi:Holliday junction resolvasome RuvABC endonuclease subunit
MEIKLVGIDPSLTNFGFAHAVYDTDIDDPAKRLIIHRLTLVSTEATQVKKVRKNSDDLDRAEILYRALQAHCKDAIFAMVEVPHGSQSARAMASYGVCVGVLASCPVPLIQLRAEEVKLVAVGHKQAAKEEMIEWAIAKYPHLNWILGKVKGKVQPLAKNEHLADACAVLEAGVQTDEFKRALSLLSLKAA